MAHLVETMFYVGQVPWHGLGEHLTDAPNTKEAIIAAGLDWKVQVQPVLTPAFMPMTMVNPVNGSEIVGDGSFADVSGFVDVAHDLEPVKLGGVVRRVTDGAMLGMVGPRWTPVQNSEAFAWFDPLVESGLARLHTAGSLRNGKIVWILAQIGQELPVTGNDTIGQFLLLCMGHDGVRGVWVSPTPIRVVCANTMNMAIGGAVQSTFKLKHRANVLTRLNELRDFITPYLENFESTVNVFKQLAEKPLTTVMVDEFLKSMFPDPAARPGHEPRTAKAENKRGRIVDLFEGGQFGYDAMDPKAARSAWSMYSAVTQYYDHENGRSADSRMSSAWIGQAAQKKQQALETLLAVV